MGPMCTLAHLLDEGEGELEEDEPTDDDVARRGVYVVVEGHEPRLRQQLDGGAARLAVARELDLDGLAGALLRHAPSDRTLH